MSSDHGTRPAGRATIEDVALRAGVSVATVSRALRGLPNVATSTRQHVSQVAADLHYRPHPAATRLAAGKTTTITVAVPTLNGWYFATVVAGAEAVCREEGYDFIVIGIGSVDDLHHLVAENEYLEERTDGLILVDLVIDATEADSLTERGLQFGTIGSVAPGHPAVVVDDVGVGELATRHLLDLGHRRIGVIGGAKHDPMSIDVSHSRRTGFERAMRGAGLDADPGIVASGNFGIDGGQEAMGEILDHPDPPTAVFAMSDEMAFGALMEIRSRGLEVGTDVSMIGVDDHEFSRVVGLTTVRHAATSHGAVAARQLIDRMRREQDRSATSASETPDGSELVHHTPVELVRRTSTGPPSRPASPGADSGPGTSRTP